MHLGPIVTVESYLTMMVLAEALWKMVCMGLASIVAPWISIS